VNVHRFVVPVMVVVRLGLLYWFQCWCFAADALLSLFCRPSRLFLVVAMS